MNIKEFSLCRYYCSTVGPKDKKAKDLWDLKRKRFMWWKLRNMQLGKGDGTRLVWRLELWLESRHSVLILFNIRGYPQMKFPKYLRKLPALFYMWVKFRHRYPVKIYPDINMIFFWKMVDTKASKLAENGMNSKCT